MSPRASLLLCVIAQAPIAACGGSNEPAEAPRSEVTIPGTATQEEEPEDAERDVPAPSRRAGREGRLGGRVPSDSACACPPSDPLCSCGPHDTGVAAPAGGPDCLAAAACCLQVLQAASPANPAMFSTCHKVKTMPSSVCASVLQSFMQLASSQGLQC